MFWDTVVGSLGMLVDPLTWVFIVLGALYGVFVGAVPGMGTTLGFALLIPVTFVVSPAYAVAMLLALAVGSQFGNSIPAILVGVPGTASAIMTVMDGHSLYKQGKGDVALGASWLASMGGQALGIPLFVLLVIPLANLAYVFQAPELFAMYTLGIVAIVTIAGKDMLKGLLSAGLGLIVGLVGIDPMTGRQRFTFDLASLRPGLTTAAVVVGILAVGEIFRQTRQAYQWLGDEGGEATGRRSRVRLPSLKRMGGRDIVPALLGGTLIGTFVGAIPGAGATPAALISYQQAKLWSKRPEEFGEGSLTGIIANEAAQNASSSGELIPTLALGIPGSGSMLILLTALTAQGFVPGPFMVREAPELLYAAVAGLLGGTIILTLTGMRMAGWMLHLARVDRSLVLVSSLAIVVVGMFALRNSVLDVFILLGAGVVGFLMYRYGYSPPAAALAVVLSSGFESSLRHGLALSDDSVLTMVSRPVTAALLAVSFAFLVAGFWKDLRRRGTARGTTLERDRP